MVYLFYRLALEPQHAEKIRDEIHSISSIYDPQGLKTLNHLNGAINEILRLHPSVPTGGYRETPPQGIEIAGRFIPGNITIVSPRYTMGRRTSSLFLPNPCIISSRTQHGNEALANLSLLTTVDKSFARASEFVPERWYSRPEMVTNQRAFTPFSIGRYACVGKNLALAELRFVTALLVSKYDISFAPGEDGTSCWRDMRDQFTAAPGKLELVFTPRAK